MDETQNELSYQEKREQRKEERAREASQMKKGKGMKSFLLWAGMLAVLAGIVYGLSRVGSQTPQSATGTLAVPVSDADWSKGNKDAAVTLVEYSDLQCPACGAYYPILKQVTAELGDKIRFVYRHFPLNSVHPNADAAARAAEAAGYQNKFWEMHDKIFENQPKWSNQSKSAVRETFIGYARELGLDITKFEDDMDSSRAKDKIKSDVEGANQAGVNSTPTFYLNGQKIVNPRSVDEFKKLINNAQPNQQ